MPACARPGVYVPRQTHDCDAAVLARPEEAGHALPEFVKAELEGPGPRVCRQRGH